MVTLSSDVKLMILRVMSVIDDKTVIYCHTRTYTLLDKFSRACYTNPNMNLPIRLSEPWA